MNNDEIEAYIPLARKIASEFLTRHPKLDPQELQSVALEALVVAAHKYATSNTNYRFGVFASRVISCDLMDYINKSDFRAKFWDHDTSLEDDDSEEWPPATSDSDPQLEAEWAERIDQLDPVDRQIVKMVLGGHTRKSIGLKVKLTARQVRYRLQKLKK